MDPVARVRDHFVESIATKETAAEAYDASKQTAGELYDTGKEKAAGMMDSGSATNTEAATETAAETAAGQSQAVVEGMTKPTE